MFGKKAPPPDPRLQASKMSALSWAWGVVAGVAYLGLIYQFLSLLAGIVNGAAGAPSSSPVWTPPSIDHGLVSIIAGGANVGVFKLTGVYATVAQVSVIALPFAILAVIGLGIASHPLQTQIGVHGLLIAASIVGLVASLVLFIANVATLNNGVQFAVAIATVVLVWILVRLQRLVRRFYDRAPAIATIVLALATIIYLIFSNGVNFQSIILTQIDVWLSIVAFAIALYSAVNLARHGRAISRNRARMAARPMPQQRRY